MFKKLIKKIISFFGFEIELEIETEKRFIHISNNKYINYKIPIIYDEEYFFIKNLRGLPNNAEKT